MIPLAKKKSVVKDALGKVTGAVGTAMALPWTIASNMKIDKSSREASILKNARNSKGAPQFNNGVPTDAFKYQTLADGIKQKYKNK